MTHLEQACQQKPRELREESREEQSEKTEKDPCYRVSTTG